VSYVDATLAPIKLVLELYPAADPVAGRLHLDDRDPLTFNGYLELMSLLEEVRRTQRPGKPPREIRSGTRSPEQVREG
jgi:hypothetical protein